MEGRMDLKQLEYFVHVAELGSFTRAASLLRVAQPALSRQVRKLELELKQPLLYRNGRGVVATEAGKRLLAHGRGILMQVGRATQEVAGVKSTPIGHVVVGMPPSVAKMSTVPLVREFRRRFPEASLGIVEGLTVYVQEWLLMGRVDIALLYNPMPSPALELQPFLDEPLYLIRPKERASSASRAVSLRDLPRFRLIIPSRPHAIRMHVETQLAHLGLKPQVAFEVDGVSALLDLVAEGHGCAVLPINAIRGAGARPGLRAQPITKPRLQNRLAIALSAQRPATPLLRGTLALLREVGSEALAKARKGGSPAGDSPRARPARAGSRD